MSSDLRECLNGFQGRGEVLPVAEFKRPAVAMQESETRCCGGEGGRGGVPVVG